MFKVWAGIAAVVILAILASLLLPKEMALTLEAPGKILPTKEWRLIQADDGALRGTLQDHVKGTVNSYAINRFERGDAIQVRINEGIFDQRFIASGDTVGSIYSSEIDIRLTELQGELATRQASLRMAAAGKKPELIEEARQGVVRAESRAREHKNVLARLQQLFEQELVAEEELQAAQSLMEVYEADVAMAQAQLAARETGARQEEIDHQRAKMQALEESITALQNRLQLQTIVSPLDGYIARSFAPDTLLTVRDTTGFLVLMPIAWNERHLLETGSDVSVSVPGTDIELAGELMDLGDTIHRINGEQVVSALAYLKGYSPQILPGVMVNTTISCGNVPFSTYLNHMLN